LPAASTPGEPARAAAEAKPTTGSEQTDLLSSFLDPNGWGGDFLTQALNSTGLTDTSDAAAALADNKSLLYILVGLGVVLAIVGPLLKFFIAGISTLFFFQIADERFNSQNKSRRQGQGVLEKVLRRLSGEPEDALDLRNLKVKRLNDELVGLQANLIEQADSQGAAQAHRDRRRAKRFRGIWEATLASLDLTDSERSEASEAVRKFREDVESLEEEMVQVKQRWRESLLSNDNFLGPVSSFARRYEAVNKQERLYKLQEKLLQELREALPENKFEDLRSSLSKQDELAWLAEAQGQPVGAAHAVATGTQAPRRIYVLKFDGDLGASGAEDLSREISAILSAPGPQPEEVVLLLKSPGGSVTGYGLAAAELLRLRQRDPPVKLTVCVDELAASGGYLMACCADKILCSPFAAVGSIGVIAQIPNAAKRLEREGLDFIQTTAGKWKRTVTPFKVPTQEDLDKQKEDIGAVYREFASFVQKNRPHVDIEQVATGEVWYGPDALARQLVDELKTSAQYLLECIEGGAEVFSVQFKRPSEGSSGLLPAGASAGRALLEALLARQLGQQQSAGAMGGVQDLLQRFAPQGLGRSGPLLRAPEEQLAPQLLAEGYVDEVEKMDPASRERLLEALLFREVGL